MKISSHLKTETYKTQKANKNFTAPGQTGPTLGAPRHTALQSPTLHFPTTGLHFTTLV